MDIGWDSVACLFVISNMTEDISFTFRKAKVLMEIYLYMHFIDDDFNSWNIDSDLYGMYVMDIGSK